MVQSADQTFLSCDWGTSRFRLRLVDCDSLEVLSQVETQQGIGPLNVSRTGLRTKEVFEAVFRTHVLGLPLKDSLPATAVISGMACSNLGWLEIPYARAPLPLDPRSFQTKSLSFSISESAKMNLVFVSGFRADEDVMRGEEVELLGLYRLMPELSNHSNTCIVLPGTHSKHAIVCKGVLTNFRTFMTGELFAHLQAAPTLASCFWSEQPLDEDTFLDGVTLVAREGLAAALFKIRARHLLWANENQSARSLLSGMLIGSEILELRSMEDCWLFCDSSVGRLYEIAADYCNCNLRLVPEQIYQQALLSGQQAFL